MGVGVSKPVVGKLFLIDGLINADLKILVNVMLWKSTRTFFLLLFHLVVM